MSPPAKDWRERLGAPAPTGRRAKFGNRKVVIDDLEFDSAKEGRRYCELKLLQRGKQISGLRMQVPYALDVKGIPVCRYVADFVYLDEKTGETVVEDVKSPITAKDPTYRIKVKLMHAVHGITVREV